MRKNKFLISRLKKPGFPIFPCVLKCPLDVDVEIELVQMMAGYFYRYPTNYGLRIPCMQLVIANLKLLIDKYEKDWNRYFNRCI